MYGNYFVLIAKRKEKEIQITYNALDKALKNYDRLLNREHYERADLFLVNGIYKVGDYMIKSNIKMY